MKGFKQFNEDQEKADRKSADLALKQAEARRRQRDRMQRQADADAEQRREREYISVDDLDSAMDDAEKSDKESWFDILKRRKR